MYIITVEDLTGQILSVNPKTNEHEFISAEIETLEEAEELIKVFKNPCLFGTSKFRIWLYDTVDETAELVSNFPL